MGLREGPHAPRGHLQAAGGGRAGQAPPPERDTDRCRPLPPGRPEAPLAGEPPQTPGAARGRPWLRKERFRMSSIPEPSVNDLSPVVAKGVEKQPVALVDISGSMTWAVTEGSSTSRREVVGEAMGLLVKSLEDEDSQAAAEQAGDPDHEPGLSECGCRMCDPSRHGTAPEPAA